MWILNAGTFLNFRNADILKLPTERWCLSWAASWFWEPHLHRDQKIHTEWKIQNQCPHWIQLCTHNRWQNRNIPAVSFCGSCHPKVPLQQLMSHYEDAVQNHGKSKPRSVQHSNYLLSTVQLNYSIKKCQNYHLFIPAFPWEAPHANPEELFHTTRIQRHGVLIGLDFCKTQQSHKNSEFWRALKTMPGRIWKGPARNVSFGGFSDKKHEAHCVKVSWEACKQENLPIKGTPSEHNVLSNCFIRKSIYNCFLLLWTENDRDVKTLNQEEEGRQSRAAFIH